jgi:glycosyltransferase involved in cell wall biosynthesis
MRVLFLSDYFPPHVGGVEKVVDEVATRLSRMGHSASVMTMKLGDEPLSEEVGGVSVFRFPGVDLTKYLKFQIALSPSFALGAVRRAKRVRPQVLNAHTLFYSTSIFSVLLKRALGVPLVTTVHLGEIKTGSALLDFAVRSYEFSIGRLLMRESAAVIAVSRAVEEHLVQMGVPKSKIFLVPNGVDYDHFTGAYEARRPNEFEILFIGRLVPNKGLHFVIEAAPELVKRHPSVRFVVVGEGPMKAQALGAVRAAGLSRFFRFVDSVDDVREPMKTAFVMVRPSLTEGLPLTVMEAMAAGVPVVAFAVAGTPEIISDGYNGMLVPSADSGRLSQALTRLIMDPAEARQMGERARASMRERSWDAVAGKTLAVYSSVAGSGP